MERRMFTLPAFVIFFFLTPASVSPQTAVSQRAQDEQRLDYARTVFTQLIGSEDKARTLVAKLDTYHYDAPWQLSTLLTIAQRMLVKEWKAEDIPPLFWACGDAAAAIDGDDEKFAEIVAAIVAIKTGHTSEVDSLLNELEELGLPAFKLVAEAIGKTPADVRRLAKADRIVPSVTARILLDQFARRYEGLANKLARQRKEP